MILKFSFVFRNLFFLSKYEIGSVLIKNGEGKKEMEMRKGKVRGMGGIGKGKMVRKIKEDKKLMREERKERKMEENFC